MPKAPLDKNAKLTKNILKLLKGGVFFQQWILLFGTQTCLERSKRRMITRVSACERLLLRKIFKYLHHGHQTHEKIYTQLRSVRFASSTYPKNGFKIEFFQKRNIMHPEILVVTELKFYYRIYSWKLKYYEKQMEWLHESTFLKLLTINLLL